MFIETYKHTWNLKNILIFWKLKIFNILYCYYTFMYLNSIFIIYIHLFILTSITDLHKTLKLLTLKKLNGIAATAYVISES